MPIRAQSISRCIGTLFRSKPYTTQVKLKEGAGMKKWITSLCVMLALAIGIQMVTVVPDVDAQAATVMVNDNNNNNTTNNTDYNTRNVGTNDMANNDTPSWAWLGLLGLLGLFGLRRREQGER